MAKSAALIDINFRLELTLAEAEWLRAVLQNSMCPPDEEPAEAREMRKALFDALKDAHTLRQTAVAAFGEPGE